MFTWLDKLIQQLVENIFGLDMTMRLGASIHFFIYDVIKILILLSITIFVISYIRSYFPPERTKKILEKFTGIKGNIMASLLGIVTPFCSCSSVPIFIGFVEARIPLGVTFSFLITSPIVNEAAFAILLVSFGWRIAVLYVVTGVVIGVIGGMLIGHLKMEEQVEEYVYNIRAGEVEIKQLTNKERARFAFENVRSIVKRIWIYLIIGIGIGAVIRGLDEDGDIVRLLVQYAGRDNPIGVFIGVLFGIPLYSNALGTIPIAEALINKGVGIGTALAFMMAVTALSLPAIILLRKVIKPKLISSFVIITGIAIIIVGYLFNSIEQYLI